MAWNIHRKYRKVLADENKLWPGKNGGYMPSNLGSR